MFRFVLGALVGGLAVWYWGEEMREYAQSRTVGVRRSAANMLVTVPTLRVVSFVRGRRDTYVPLVTTVESYPLAAKVVLDTLERHGIRMIAVEPPWWAAMPSNILKRFGQGAFTGYTADQSAYFRSGDLEAVLYPNTLLLRGPGGVAARAHALAVEALTGHPDMFQTVSPDAQEIERQIQRVWSAYRLAPSAHANAAPLLSRFDEIALEIARRPLSFDDWQVIYRQVLQLGRALGGRRQILEVALPKETDMRPALPVSGSATSPASTIAPTAAPTRLARVVRSIVSDADINPRGGPSRRARTAGAPGRPERPGARPARPSRARASRPPSVRHRGSRRRPGCPRASRGRR